LAWLTVNTKVFRFCIWRLFHACLQNGLVFQSSKKSANAAPSDQQLALLIQNKELIEICHVSQPVFARYLNTSASTVQKWESGAKRPSGMALKLLAVVEKHGLKVLA
jgi:DNA-binding transcriptional regulator YiaG